MSLAKALEIRASYRLCGALLMVGDGARMDALGMIDDAKCMFFTLNMYHILSSPSPNENSQKPKLEQPLLNPRLLQ